MATSPNDPTSRALRLLSLLQTHRFWPGGELAARLGVSERTVRRDVDRLRELGYRVDASPGAAGGYQLAKGTSLPPLLLDDDEAVAVAVGLRAASAAAINGMEETSLRAMAKLEQVLPDRLRRRVNALHANVSSLHWSAGGTSDEQVDAEALALLAQACRDHEEVRFEYVARDGAGTDRLVEPHRLVTAGSRWYLVAYDARRQDWRTFRVDRLAEVRLAGARFRPRPAPGGSFEAYLAASLGPRAELSARVLVHATEAEVRAGGGFRRAAIEARGDGTSVVTVTSDTTEWLLAMIGLLAASYDVEVLEPPAVVDAVAAFAGRLRGAPSRTGHHATP